jgi:peptidyl-prolyl cis-trans isomerase SurA
MILRSLQFQTVLAASLVIVAIPVVGQAARATDSNGPHAPAAQASPFQGTVVEDILARIDDQVISRSDFERAQHELEQQAREQNWTDAQVEQGKKDLLRELIDRQLLLSRGKELGITGETDLVKRLDDIRKQNHLDTMEDLQKAAESQGVSYEDFKANLRNNIVTSEVMRNEVSSHISITQSDIQRYYDAHKAEFSQPEQVRLSEILVPVAGDDPAAVSAAQAKADDLEAQLKAGGKFDDLAKANSSGPTAAKGGDLGPWKRGQLSKIFEDKTFVLPAGQIADPIRTKQGFVIFKVTEHQPGGAPALKDVQQQVEEAVGMQKMEPAVRTYMTKLREDSYVDIKPGYVDTGASPNQTKPMYSAYTPPTGKKKKHVERTRYRQKATRRNVKSLDAVNAPSSVPSLAQVPQGGTATANTSQPPAATAKNSQVASAKSTMKPGKKEKIRYGQAPRETLPTGETRNEDAGATGHTTESAQAAGAAGTANGSEGTQVAAGSVPKDIHTVGGEEAVDEGTPAPKVEKTRFAARAKQPKQKKSKTKVDPFAPPPVSDEEIATQKTQSTPLGLAGDTTKKPKKPKPTKKTRLQDESKPAEPAPPAPPPVEVPPTNLTPTPGPAPSAPPAPATTPQQ